MYTPVVCRKGFVPLLLCLVLTLLITSCDDRGGDKPTLTVSFETNRLYGEGAYCNINHSIVTFILEGEPSFIQNAKILVEYDKLRGTFVGTGSSDFVITGTDGTATGTYLAQPTAYGATPFQARLERFRNVKETVTIYLFDLPEIILDADELTIGLTDNTNLYVEISDRADNIADIPIRFTTTGGLLAFNTVRTDNQGKAENVFDAGGQPGNAIIRASLGFCNNKYREITINRRAED